MGGDVAGGREYCNPLQGACVEGEMGEQGPPAWAPKGLGGLCSLYSQTLLTRETHNMVIWKEPWRSLGLTRYNLGTEAEQLHKVQGSWVRAKQTRHLALFHYAVP